MADESFKKDNQAHLTANDIDDCFNNSDNLLFANQKTSQDHTYHLKLIPSILVFLIKFSLFLPALNWYSILWNLIRGMSRCFQNCVRTYPNSYDFKGYQRLIANFHASLYSLKTCICNSDLTLFCIAISYFMNIEFIFQMQFISQRIDREINADHSYLCYLLGETTQRMASLVWMLLKQRETTSPSSILPILSFLSSTSWLIFSFQCASLYSLKCLSKWLLLRMSSIFFTLILWNFCTFYYFMTSISYSDVLGLSSIDSVFSLLTYVPITFALYFLFRFYLISSFMQSSPLFLVSSRVSCYMIFYFYLMRTPSNALMLFLLLLFQRLVSFFCSLSRFCFSSSILRNSFLRYSLTQTS